MPTVLNDFATGVLSRSALASASYTDDTAGPAVDLLAGDGPAFAVLTVGTLATGTTVGGYLEESADGVSWDGIAGADFAPVTTANSIRAVTFRRSARYVRAVVTLAGSSPQAHLAVVIGQEAKLV